MEINDNSCVWPELLKLNHLKCRHEFTILSASIYRQYYNGFRGTYKGKDINRVTNTGAMCTQ